MGWAKRSGQGVNINSLTLYRDHIFTLNCKWTYSLPSSSDSSAIIISSTLSNACLTVSWNGFTQQQTRESKKFLNIYKQKTNKQTHKQDKNKTKQIQSSYDQYKTCH